MNDYAVNRSGTIFVAMNGFHHFAWFNYSLFITTAFNFLTMTNKTFFSRSIGKGTVTRWTEGLLTVIRRWVLWNRIDVKFNLCQSTGFWIRKKKIFMEVWTILETKKNPISIKVYHCTSNSISLKIKCEKKNSTLQLELINFFFSCCLNENTSQIMAEKMVKKPHSFRVLHWIGKSTSIVHI